MKRQNYRNPVNKDDTVWKFGTSTDLPYFTWLQTQGDDRQRAFANHMKFKSIPQNWYDTVTLSEILPAEFDPREVLMVDVGGNSGHDVVGCKQFLHFCHTRGLSVLQPNSKSHVGLQILRQAMGPLFSCKTSLPML